MNISKIDIDFGARSYEISIGGNLLGNSECFEKAGIKGRAVFIITDENVAQHYLDKTAKTIMQAGADRVFSKILPPGESSKSFSKLEEVMNWMLGNVPDRKSVVVALGGGVIGDLAGLAASLLLRGVDYVQVPTTLLSQIDSSIGGKTAIDTKHGKNLVGTFYQPRAVIIDTSTLGTLSERHLKAGYGEGVKHAALADEKFFTWLEKNGEDVLSLKPEAVAEFVERNCKIKAAVVQEDETEKGKRALLNLGHTFGHALETVCGFSGLLIHGEAVATGMVMAFELSKRMELCKAEDVNRLKNHLKKSGLPVSISEIDIPASVTAEELILLMKGDKKSVSGKINFVLVKGIGSSFVCGDVEIDMATEVIRDSMNSL